MKCICDQTKVDVKCGYCKTPFEKAIDTDQIRFYCPEHQPIFICGKGGETCKSCQDAGWTVYAGYGGPPYAKNKNTGEKVNI